VKHSLPIPVPQNTCPPSGSRVAQA
jgi:hypothetical protein